MERREEARAHSAAVLRIAEPVLISADIIDLSTRGLCFRSRMVLEPGRNVDFDLQLPGGQTVTGRAMVRWRQSDGPWQTHGLQLIEVEAMQRRRLFKHLTPRRADVIDYLDLCLQFSCLSILLLIAQRLFWR